MDKTGYRGEEGGRTRALFAPDGKEYGYPRSDWLAMAVAMLLLRGWGRGCVHDCANCSHWISISHPYGVRTEPVSRVTPSDIDDRHLAAFATATPIFAVGVGSSWASHRIASYRITSHRIRGQIPGIVLLCSAGA